MVAQRQELKAQRVQELDRRLAPRQVAQQVVAERVAAVQQQHVAGTDALAHLPHRSRQHRIAADLADARERLFFATGVAGLRGRVAGRDRQRQVAPMGVVDVRQGDVRSPRSRAVRRARRQRDDGSAVIEVRVLMRRLRSMGSSQRARWIPSG